MATHGRSPLDFLAQQIELNDAREENLERELQSLPKWRFRRRSQAQRRLEWRRERRARIDELLDRPGDRR